MNGFDKLICLPQNCLFRVSGLLTKQQINAAKLSFFLISDLQRESIMNNIEEIIQAFFIGLLAATFLLNTCRALKAIDLCKKSLLLLDSMEPSITKRIGRTLYRKIYEIMFLGYRGISDNANAITYGRKLLGICCECGDTVKEGILGLELADVYCTQSMYFEAIELYERTNTVMREIGHRAGMLWRPRSCV